MNELIQVQSVLYKNSLGSIETSATSLAQAAKAAKFNVSFSYGDAAKTSLASSAWADRLSHQIGFPVSYRQFNENTGFGKGHNQLASTGDSKFLFIMNPDLVVLPNFFSLMLGPFTIKNDTGIVEARQTPLEHPKNYDVSTGQTDWSSGACMLIERALFYELDGFDWKTFWMYCEDVDLSWRVRLQGKKLIYQAQAIAFHPKRVDNQGQMMPTKTERLYSAETALLLAYKWNDNKAIKRLEAIFSSTGDPFHREALRLFKKRRVERKLPEQIKNAGHVATFLENGTYTKHRYGV